MKGIDVYHGESINQSSALQAVPEKAYKESDFCIVKATQGTSYGHIQFFHRMIKRVIEDGKLAGAYHYAEGKDAKKEADYFIETVKPYLGKIILCLDWEKTIGKGKNNAAWGSKTWCKEFVDRVKEKTGVTCFLYTGLDGLKQCANLCGKVPLWFAGYPQDKNSWTVPKFKYNLGDWKNYDIWQYTSSGEKIDRNISPWTAAQWKKYYTKISTKSTKPTKPTLEQAAKDIINGKYGNGDARKAALKNLGFTAAEISKIQNLVNQKLKGSSTKSTKPTIEQAVKNIIDGKYGNGEARTKTLTSLGFTAAERKKIQELVNKKMG